MKKYRHIAIAMLVCMVICLSGCHRAKAYVSAKVKELTMTQEEKDRLLAESINAEIPGILCWGDSLTYGYGGRESTYPAVLEQLIAEKITAGSVAEIPVLNMGVCCETSTTILARTGVLPVWVREEFEIPADVETIECQLHLPADLYLDLCSRGDEGFNPCSINGIVGKLETGLEHAPYGYYRFTRLEPGEVSFVERETTVFPHSYGLYGGYYNIVFMGQNDVCEPEFIVDMYRRFANVCTDGRYLFVGLTTGSAESRAKLESLMAEEFGEKYLNARDEMCKHGLEYAGLTDVTFSTFHADRGMVDPALMYDDIHMNGSGYIALANIIYNKMDELGYFDGVRNILSPRSRP